MDYETALCILQVLQEDATEALDRTKGKRSENSAPSDQELALRQQLEEIERVETFFIDSTMATSIHHACIDDGPEIAVLQASEFLAFQDHDFACTLAGLAPDQRSDERNFTASFADLDDEFLESFCRIELEDEDKDISEVDETASIMSETTVKSVDSCCLPLDWKTSNRKPILECIICRDTKTSTKVPCGDHYCRGCLLELFELSLKDETLFPPRCCRKEIPISTMHDHLTKESKRKFRLKLIERASSDKTYCHSCEAFLLPDRFRGGDAICNECGGSTCRNCNNASHEGECGGEPGLEQLEQLAGEAGWRRCPSCSYMIELKHGCFHITCRCRYDFCYLCSTKWKNCGCRQWDEGYLLNRAAVIANRPNGPNGAAARPANQQEIQRVANVIRDRHNCNHVRWRVATGRQQCEECLEVLREYLLECENCLLRACVRCRRNRL